MLDKNNILGLEIELSNQCNLLCAGCVRDGMARETLNNTSLDYQVLINFLEKIDKLEFVHLVGSISEPMIYKQIKELLSYLKNRDIRVLISTNASIKNKKWWGEVGRLMNKQSEVRFCVDGHEQEIYSQYRKRGNLKKVLENAKSFIETSRCTSTLQHLIFKHNKDHLGKIKKIKEKYNFDKLYIIPSSEILDLNVLYMASRNIGKTGVNYTLECFAKDESFLYLKYDGVIIPCCNQYVSFVNKKNIYLNTIEECLEEINSHLLIKESNNICLSNCNKMTKLIEKNNNITEMFNN